LGKYKCKQLPPVVEDIEGLVGGGLLELCAKEIVSLIKWARLIYVTWRQAVPVKPTDTLGHAL
jgi:hypothetical protein